MNIHINPDYTEYLPLFRSIAENRYNAICIHRNMRNTVERIAYNGKEFAIKRYNATNILHKAIYTCFRKSKPRRAYEHAEYLLSQGIRTATPIAYIETFRAGLFHTGYFISEFIPQPLMFDIYIPDTPDDIKAALCHDLALFTLDMHLKGIVPLDYNPGNIFYRKSGEHYTFSLIDINRMSIGRVPDIRHAMKSFSQLGIRATEFLSILPEYARGRGFDLEDCIFHLLEHRQRWHRNHLRKQRLRHLFGIRPTD